MLMSKFPFLIIATITNIFSNFVPNEIIICDDRESSWMNRHIKNLVFTKLITIKRLYVEKNSMFHLLAFHNLQNHLNQFIQKAKQNYLSKVAKSLVIHRPALNVTGLC